MKPTLWGMLLLLLLASSALIATSHEIMAKGDENTGSTLNKNVTVASSGSATKATAEKARVTEHKITTSELQQMKNDNGISDPEQNYSQVVDGHGTGLCPPTEAEWAKIGASAYTVDDVEYQDGDGAPAQVDQSTKPWFPPIGNQGSQGSCVAWAVGYYVKTFQEAQEHSWDLSGATWTSGHPSVSYQNKIMSPAFIYNLINGGADAGSSYYDAISLICFVGSSSWQKMPYNLSTYTAWPSEDAWTEAASYRGNSSGYQYLSVTSDSGLTSLKNWIASGNLAVISVDANKYSGLTSADVWTLDNYVSPSTNHANTIVGYDDSINYTESGVTHYGAFKVANSWGKGGWEKVTDGFYWLSYEAMKQRVRGCMFYYDMIGYQPQLLATFGVSHQLRSECDIRVGLGNVASPIATKSFSQYVDGGSFPFPQNSIVLDITELMSYVPSVIGRTFFLRVYDGGTSTIGNVTKFAVDHEESKDAPCLSKDQTAVYLNVTLTLGKILINSALSPSLPNQKVAAGNNVSLFFGSVQWLSTQFYLLASRDNFSQVSVGDTAYTPTFNIADLSSSAVTGYTSAVGSWQVGYNWVNGTMPTGVAGGRYYFKAFADSSTSVPVSDTYVIVAGALQVTPTSGSGSAAISVEGYALSASSSANITYLNPLTSKWISIVNNTPTDALGHFAYGTTVPDLMQNMPAGDSSALFDSIVFRVQDNNDSAYYNGTVPFSEFRRGLAQLGSAVALGLYGNNTDMTSAVQVVVGRSLTVVGKWFAPGNVIFHWDGTSFDASVADDSGYFSKTLTIPATTVGAHTVRISDANTNFLVTVTVVPPLVSSDDYDGLWHTTDFTITLSSIDNGKGIAATYYRLNNGPVKSVNVDGQPRITTEGASNVLEYWSVDSVGNEELPHKVVSQIRLDKTTPTGSIGINNGASYTRSNSVTLTLTAADAASGVFQVRFSNDGVWDTEQWETPASTKSWLLTSGDGSKTVYCQIKDNAGLITTCSSSITLDTANPVANTGQSQTVNSGSLVTFDASSCTDNVGIISYSWDFGDGTTGTGITTTHTYTNKGTYTAKLTTQDAAGNTATNNTIITVQPYTVLTVPIVTTVPEFPFAILLPLFFIITLITAIIYKRKHLKTK